MNEKVRTAASNNGIPLWKVAMFAEISEPTIIRWLRVPLTPEKEVRLLNAIEQAKKEQE
ncbi:hypothetical protein JQM66_06135 [Oscillibacter valericigenes]|uniref:hypothetical protein n=1 Tax=Oscillibacter valericigenes TaxID=351091 RepID=UPI001F211D2D|nr:hypothetical protein [Oscillibacter valericigenes]MCF2664140.1 hypothetical protein [Oscillibacter valericigenes]